MEMQNEKQISENLEFTVENLNESKDNDDNELGSPSSNIGAGDAQDAITYRNMKFEVIPPPSTPKLLSNSGAAYRAASNERCSSEDVGSGGDCLHNFDGSDKDKIFQVKWRPQKIVFKLKTNENGNIFTVHHTIQENGKYIRIRLGTCCFNERGNQLVAIDKRSNIFVFDFGTKYYWRLPLCIRRASIIRPSNERLNEYYVGTKDGHVFGIDVENSKLLCAFEISNTSILHISQMANPQSTKVSIIQSVTNASIFSFQKGCTTHQLNFQEMNISLKFVHFIPNTELIFTCFTDDTVYIWSLATLNAMRKLQPLKMRDRKAKLIGVENLPKIILSDETNKFQLHHHDEDFCNGLISSFSFQRDGSQLALTTLDSYLLIMTTSTFDMLHAIRLHDFTLNSCAFLQQPNETIIIGLTTAGQMVMLDCQQTDFKVIFNTSTALHMEVPLDGRLLAVTCFTGEIEIWSTSQLYNALKSQKQCMQMLKEAFKQPKPIALNTANEALNSDLKKLLKRDRLLAILREYGCYPEKYRHLIWSTLLRLPYNTAEFQVLLKLGTPTAVRQQLQSIQLKQEATKRFLITILSCLAHWCKVFAYSSFLPELVFPFLQLFPKNALASFELCATLLLNHFQLWFEFHPLEPANYLGMCENILLHYDGELCKFYKQMDVNVKDYAWSLLSNGFSVVLSEDQWLRLWDNIVTYPPYYLVFCAVAYNVLMREVIMRLPDKPTILHFFTEQNPIDIVKFVAKSHKYMMKCPQGFHPKRYMKPFQPIPRKVYPKFLNYPKDWVNQHETELDALKREQRAIDQRMAQLEMEEMRIMQQLERGLKEEEHAKRIKAMEKLYQETLQREEERLAHQRKALLLFQTQIRNRKGAAIAALQASQKRQEELLMEKDLNSLMSHIDRERMRNDININLAEGEVRNQDLELLAQKFSLSKGKTSLHEKYHDTVQRLNGEQRELDKSMSAMTKSPPIAVRKSKQIDLNAIERQIDQIQDEIMRLIGT